MTWLNRLMETNNDGLPWPTLPWRTCQEANND